MMAIGQNSIIIRCITHPVARPDRKKSALCSCKKTWFAVTTVPLHNIPEIRKVVWNPVQKTTFSLMLGASYAARNFVVCYAWRTIIACARPMGTVQNSELYTTVLTQFVSLHDRREHLNIFFYFYNFRTPSPASSLHSETPALPPDYVLQHYTPDLQPALNATLPLYTTLY